MIKYHLEITRTAEKTLTDFHPNLQDKLIKKIGTLVDNPRPPGFKKLFASQHYRIRVGDYRIIYHVDDARRLIKILDLGHRKDIYR